MVINFKEIKSYMSYIYLLDKKTQDAVIEAYKKGLSKSRRKSWFRRKLEALKLEDITIDNLILYITNYNFRQRANQRI